MLKFSKTSEMGGEEIYSLCDDGKEIGTVTVAGNTIVKVEYADKMTDIKYGDFTLRSIVYILRGRYPLVETAFTDARLKIIGFTEYEGKMLASSLKINFDTCHCNKGETNEN